MSLGFLGKITDDTILKDVNRFMGPAARRVLVYGCVLFGIFSGFCGAVLNNAISHPSRWVLFGLPSLFFTLWIISILVSISIEKLYNVTIKNLSIEIGQLKNSHNTELENNRIDFKKTIEDGQRQYQSSLRCLEEEKNMLKQKLAKKQDIVEVVRTARECFKTGLEYNQPSRNPMEVRNRFGKALTELLSVKEYLPQEVREPIEVYNENNLPEPSETHDKTVVIVHWLRQIGALCNI
jgi:hypothetical protein